MKGGIILSSTGFLKVHAFASTAQLPLKDTAIIITAPDWTAIAMRITDQSGLIPAVEIPVPDLEESQEPGADAVPYAQVNLIAQKAGYERIVARNIQVFAGTVTYQDLEMIPLSEEPFPGEEQMQYNTPPQDL